MGNCECKLKYFRFYECWRLCLGVLGFGLTNVLFVNMYNHAAGIFNRAFTGLVFSLGAHSYLRLSSMHLSACIDSCSPNGLFGTLEAEKMSHHTFNPFANVCRQYITIKVYWHTMQWSYDKELSHNLWNVIQANFYSIKAPSSISVIIGWVTNINLNWNSLFSIQQMIDAYIIFYA